MPSQLRVAAENVLASMRRLCSAPYLIVPAKEEDFRHLGLSAYASFRWMAQREKALKDSHRIAIGWITRDELLDMTPGNAQLAGALFLEVQEVLAKERNDSPGSLRQHGD